MASIEEIVFDAPALAVEQVSPAEVKARPRAARAWWPDALRRRMLATGDMLSVLVFGVALASFSGNHSTAFVVWGLALLPLWILIAKLQGLYDADHRKLRHLTVDELSGILIWTGLVQIGTGLLSAVILVDGFGTFDSLEAWGVFFGAAVIIRAGTRALWRRITPPDRTAIVGSGPLMESTRRKLELFTDIHCKVVEQRASCTPEELREQPSWLRRVDRIILAAETLEEPLLEQLVATCRAKKLKLSIVPPGRRRLGTAVRLSQVADLPLIDYNTWDVSRSTLLVKRVFDVALASAGLVILAPLFLVVGFAALASSGRPVLFRQRRAGLHGKPFTMIKFRTMVVDAEERLGELLDFDELVEPVFKLRPDPRTTRIGRVMRRFSLDELPQLWNVLRGDMSLVGPRPEQVEVVERYDPDQRFRLSVKPGMTGPMQVHGRGDLTFEERLAVERDYIENLAPGRDLRLLALTIAPLLNGRGAW